MQAPMWCNNFCCAQLQRLKTPSSSFLKTPLFLRTKLQVVWSISVDKSCIALQLTPQDFFLNHITPINIVSNYCPAATSCTTSVKMRPKRGPWSQRIQGDCRGGYKTILWWILLYYSPAEEDIRLRVLFPSSAGYNNLTKLLPKEETQLGDCTVTNEQNPKNNNINVELVVLSHVPVDLFQFQC